MTNHRSVSASLMTNEKAGQQARVLSQEIMEPIRKYQQSQKDPGKVHTLVILSALAFVMGVLIGRLRRNDFREARDFFMAKLEEVREEMTSQ